MGVFPGMPLRRSNLHEAGKGILDNVRRTLCECSPAAVVTAPKLITKTALIVLLGQWLLGMLAGSRRDGGASSRFRPDGSACRLALP